MSETPDKPDKGKLFESWQSRFGVSTDQLSAWYDAMLKETKLKSPTLNEEEAERRALSRVYTQCQRRSENELVNCTLYGDSGVVDWVRLRKVGAIALYTKDKEKALTDGVVKVIDGKPVAVDARPILIDDSPNPEYGKPLKGKSLERTFYCYNEKYPRIRVTIRDIATEQVEAPLFKEVQFLGRSVTSRIEGETQYLLASKFQVLGEPKDFPKKLLENPMFVPFKDIPEHLKEEVISEADVMDVQFQQNRCTVTLCAFDSEHTIRVSLPKSFTVNFGRDSKVIFGSRINSKTGKYNRYNASGFLIYAIPEFITQPGAQTPLADLKAPAPSGTPQIVRTTQEEPQEDEKAEDVKSLFERAVQSGTKKGETPPPSSS